MAYNRWLSSQYSYSSGYDLMHYGRKGMRWGKHIFGLPEITLNGGGGGAVDLEELKKLLEQGKITLDEFKARAEKHFQSVADVNKDGLKQVQDKFADYMKKVSDTYENFKAGDSANKKPEVSNKKNWDEYRYYSDDFKKQSDGSYFNPITKSWKKTPTETKKKKLIDGRWKTDDETGDATFYERASGKTESKISRKRVESRIEDRKGQESRDRKENLERKRAERASAPRKVSKSSNQNAASSKGDYSLEDIVRLAFSSTASSSSSSNPSAAKPKSTSPKQQSSATPKSEPHSLTPKQKKVYETIGKFLNFTMNFNPYYRATKRITKR